MARRCEVCGSGIHGASPAHTRFCSGACRQKSYRRRNGFGVPAELRERPRWVRASRSKVPLTPSGRAASSTNPATWSPYAQVRSFTRKGFVLNGDGICCIDLDHCLTDGRPAPWAAELLERLPSTYVEVSPSGTGLHVFGYGTVPNGRVIRDDRAIEIYGTGRYIQISGLRYGNSPSRLADISAVVTSLL